MNNHTYEYGSILELIQRFPDDLSARKHYESIRWADRRVCPHCGHDHTYELKGGKKFKCADCKRKFTVTTGTIFEDSKIGMHKWFITIHLVMNHKKGISSHQLARDIGISQRSAWFVLHRIRFAVQTNSFLKHVKGVAQVDETYVGGKETNKHKDKKTKQNCGRSTKTKTAVVGIRDGHGNVFARTTEDVKVATVHDFIHENVAKGTIVMTDEYFSYKGLSAEYDHRICNHGQKEWVTGWDTHTNGVENYWSHFKRSIIGIYHQVSRKHLNKYLAAQSYRYSYRKITDWERFTLLLDKASEKRLTYKSLIAA